jgi:hypothetical protein
VRTPVSVLGFALFNSFQFIPKFAQRLTPVPPGPVVFELVKGGGNQIVERN